jgi:putative endonuclease
MNTINSRIAVIMSEVEGYSKITRFFIIFRMTSKVILSEVEGYNIYNINLYMNNYYVYILSTKFNKLFYIWVTNNLQRRFYEHKNKLVDWFTKKYNIDKLVYYEECWDIKDAIKREKQLKWQTRIKKEKLIKEMNQHLNDLGLDLL